MSNFQAFNYNVLLFLPLLYNPGAGESLVQNTRIWERDFWLCLKPTELDRQNSGKTIVTIVSISQAEFCV